ncbi:uncharacterized protein JCM10292_002194 [Rhodotorula paludigena]|uniref:uncharacterized protein n=1 Tax=Rhodotorula paludigena TaxID=86838 RepID=UPI00318132EE
MAPVASSSAEAKASPAEQPKDGAAAQNGADAGDLMADADPRNLEDEEATGPAANWEVAYVWSFIERFTGLVDFDAQDPVMPNVMSFEQALLDSSPPPPPAPQRAATRKARKPLSAISYRASLASNGNGKRAASPASSLSELTASEDDSHVEEHTAHVLAASAEYIDPKPPTLPKDAPVPPSSQLLRDIFDVFQANLKPIKELNDYHGKKTWFHFLINFVTNRFQSDLVTHDGFRWETNLLRTRGLKPGQETEKNFWLLRWEDKIHLMRKMVDYQLLHCPSVRDLIKENYDLGNQRIAKRDPDSNGLVVLPVGRTSTQLTIWHLDSSPRLYASGDPYRADSAWIAICSTFDGYKAFIKTLAAPTKADKKNQGLRGPFAKAAAGGKKAKGKDGKEDKKAEERLLRARLEDDLKEIAEYEQHMAALEARKARAAERAASRDARVARQLSRLSYGTTRSSRLRTRGESARVDYNELENGDDASGSAANGDGGDEEDGSRRKRRRTQKAEDAYEDSLAASEADETGSVASGSRGGSRRTSGRPVIPGERRSNRLQLKDEPVDDEASVEPAADEVEAEEEPAPAAAAPAEGDAVVKTEEKPTVASDAAAPDTVPATPAEGPEELVGEAEAKKEEATDEAMAVEA